MKNYPVYLRNTLNSVIREMAKHPEKFCRNPGKDFTRNRKLPFAKVLSLLLKMGGHSLRDEMLDHLCFKDLPASVSALFSNAVKYFPKQQNIYFEDLHNFLKTQNCIRDTACWLWMVQTYSSLQTPTTHYLIFRAWRNRCTTVSFT